MVSFLIWNNWRLQSTSDGMALRILDSPVFHVLSKCILQQQVFISKSLNDVATNWHTIFLLECLPFCFVFRLRIRFYMTRTSYSHPYCTDNRKGFHCDEFLLYALPSCSSSLAPIGPMLLRFPKMTRELMKKLIYRRIWLGDFIYIAFAKNSMFMKMRLRMLIKVLCSHVVTIGAVFSLSSIQFTTSHDWRVIHELFWGLFPCSLPLKHELDNNYCDSQKLSNSEVRMELLLEVIYNLHCALLPKQGELKNKYNLKFLQTNFTFLCYQLLNDMKPSRRRTISSGFGVSCVGVHTESIRDNLWPKICKYTLLLNVTWQLASMAIFMLILYLLDCVAAWISEGVSVNNHHCCWPTQIQ